MSEINANIQSNNNNILIILVGNKLDEERNRMVTKKEGERLAQVNEYYFIDNYLLFSLIKFDYL
ncbi:unnamed protein product [Schistosoma curassoni]|uniref:Small monomeric GTPase n=1 Tax=Schistosoma curassoni TaxID=6186 RepID=A0A183KY34_9TREM|nr:unnamed protein product [Schistosoma curassoni]